MQEITCPECGSANPISEDMCDQCGALLEPVASTPAVPEPEETCPGCGKKVTAEMKFCNGCGAGLRQAPPPPPPPPDDPAGATMVAPPPVPVVSRAPEPVLLPEPLPRDEDEGVNTIEPVNQGGGGEDISAAPSSDDGSANGSTIFKLTCVEGFRVGKQYLLYKDDMLLGRLDAESEIYPDIELEDQDDGYVSRRHARIRKNGSRVTVQDLGGENGTFIDGRPCPPMKELEVRCDQVIRLGKVSLMLTSEGPAGGPAPRWCAIG